jgi:SNF2 family DNA or RNA helicase
MHFGMCIKYVFMKTGTILILTGKLQVLDRLLRQLKADHHRVLIFTQMTRMLDVLEAFLNFHGHIYLRLDGTTRIDQRQVCVCIRLLST